jgi:WD40 repeat protein
MRSTPVPPNLWWGNPKLLLRFLGVKKAVLLLGSIVGISIAIFGSPQSPDPPSLLLSPPKQETAWIRGLAYAGGSLMVATVGGPAPQNQLVGLRVWDAATGRQRSAPAGHAGGIVAVAFTPDGRRMASTGYDCAIKVWDVATGHQQAALHGRQTQFHPLAFAPGGGLAWLENGFVQHWDPVTGAVWVGPREAVGEAVSMAFSPDGQLLATGGTPTTTDFATRLWELPAGTLRAALPRNSHPILSVAFAASGRVLATGDTNGDVQLWDTATGWRIRALAGYTTPVRALAFSSDDRNLAGGDVQGTVKV